MDNKEIENRIEEIKEELRDLVNSLNDTQLDFFQEQSEELSDINYLEDRFSEFADNNISVYYSDQEQYYFNNQTSCEIAFRNMGYELKDFETISDMICKAGVCGWYEDILNDLYEDNRLKDIKDLQEELEDLQEQLEEGEE